MKPLQALIFHRSILQCIYMIPTTPTYSKPKRETCTTYKRTLLRWCRKWLGRPFRLHPPRNVLRRVTRDQPKPRHAVRVVCIVFLPTDTDRQLFTLLYPWIYLSLLGSLPTSQGPGPSLLPTLASFLRFFVTNNTSTCSSQAFTISYPPLVSPCHCREFRVLHNLAPELQYFPATLACRDCKFKSLRAISRVPNVWAILPP